MQWKNKLKLQALKPLGINLKNKKKINFTKKNCGYPQAYKKLPTAPIYFLGHSEEYSLNVW